MRILALIVNRLLWFAPTLLGLLLIVFVLFAPQGLSGLFPARRKTP